MKTNIEFQCTHCEYRLKIEYGIYKDGGTLAELLEVNCPKCNEDYEFLWAYVGRKNPHQPN